ncbi:GldG family protein [uncultured Salinisphaera sp.]|uniref:GldG family protein n=1 Tax=uncultured Salinisphaera sp. TaxID=359372 RepID=UPI0032B1958C
MRASHGLSLALIVVAALMAGAVSQRFSISADWTAGNRNSLSPASRQVLDALDAGPVSFTAYIYPGPRRAEVAERLERYTRASSQVHLDFVDPARDPQQVRALGIGDKGAVQIRYQGRSQTVTDFSEKSVTNALQKLSVAKNQWVVFLSGHGERSPAEESNGGYSELAAALDAQGMATRSLNIAEAAAIPDNAALVVVASPQRSLLPGEVRMLRDYVERGGALLWADDPGPRYGLEPLARDLGLSWLPGTVIYPDFRELGTGHPAIALVANYPNTPITENLTQIGLFPYAGALARLDNAAAKGWKAETFLRSSTRSWLETGPIDGQQSLTFQPDQGDIRGPLDMGIALTRAVQTDAGRFAQRVAVIADSDFMTNGHLERLGNRPLALALFQWLAFRDAQIAVDVAKAPDTRLQLSPAQIRGFWWVYVLILPLGLIGFGLLRWQRRRRR